MSSFMRGWQDALMRIAGSMMLLALSSCDHLATPQVRSSPTTLPILSWPVGISPDAARNLTPDECKAILVAKAAIESSRGDAIHARFKVEKVGDGWVVTAFYTYPPGYLSPPGNFTAVWISRDWLVKRVIGGA